MNYASVDYLIGFLLSIFLVYSIVPAKARGPVLLGASFVFYWLYSGTLIFLLLAVSTVVYIAGLVLGDIRLMNETALPALPRDQKKTYRQPMNTARRTILNTSVIFSIGLLLFIKYYNFFVSTVDAFSRIGLSTLSWLVQPIGISFFTLEAVGYLTDVYHGKIAAEHNWAKLTLFLAFFPQIVEGPIARYSETADALWAGHRIDYDHIVMALELIAWGMLKKKVIADRADIYVRNIFNSYTSYSGTTIAFAGLLYTLQLYADFSGCIDIARGSAELFGVSLPKNFDRPFSSHTVTEFWRRWHMSLGSWLRDYVFIPLSLSKPMMRLHAWSTKHLNAFLGGLLPESAALLVTWFVTGLWHGAAWKYVLYGLYYFLLINAGLLCEPLSRRICEKLKLNRTGKGFGFFQQARTFVLVCTGMLLFRANTASDFFGMMGKIFSDFHISQLLSGAALMNDGLDVGDYIALGIGLVLVWLSGHLQKKGSVRQRLMQKPLALQWAVEFGLLFCVIILGAYGTGYLPVDPIYGKF